MRTDIGVGAPLVEKNLNLPRTPNVARGAFLLLATSTIPHATIPDLLGGNSCDSSIPPNVQGNLEPFMLLNNPFDGLS